MFIGTLDHLSKCHSSASEPSKAGLEYTSNQSPTLMTERITAEEAHSIATEGYEKQMDKKSKTI